MKIAYVTVYDVLNQQKWPKTQLGLCQAGYTIAKTLERQYLSLEYVGGLKKKTSLMTRAKWEFYHRFYQKDYYRWAEPLIVQDYGQQVYNQLSTIDYDVIFCPENVIPLAGLNSLKPIVLWTDAPLCALINFYPYLSNLCQETLQNIYQIEKAALDKCHLVIYASDWGAEAAINQYNINPAKVKVIPWGANLEENRTIEDIHTIIDSRAVEPCRLLHLGVEWFRKGGDIALEVAKMLNHRGLKTELIIAGNPPITSESLPNYVKYFGYLKKSIKDDQDKLNHLISSSHFLILPSKADCSPHVLCESNSFGLPCLTTDIGGISSIIKDGLNGQKFAVDASISDYCDYIIALMNHYDKYQKLALSSFQEYQSRLNWNVACQQVQSLLQNVILESRN